MLAIVTWLWGTKYGPEDVRRLARGVARHLQQEYKFVVCTDNVAAFEGEKGIPAIEIDECDRHLLEVKGCFARLSMFDQGWQLQPAFCNVERFVCMDLDSVVTGPLDPLFNRAERFVILQGANAANPCPFNGSLWMVRRFCHWDVYQDFSLEKAKAVPFYEFPDDQGWMHHKIPNAAGWKVGSQSGVYAFQKPGWPKGDDLPKDARLVVFPGWRSPDKFKHLPWVKEHWQ